MLEDKIGLIRNACAPLIGSTIGSYQTAEIGYSDGTWGDWPDLPIRLLFTDGQLLSVSWSKFDDLWLSNDLSLPFSIDVATTRWKANAFPLLHTILERPVRSVLIGREVMTIETREVEIWTRLIFDLANVWFEVFNALDENDYALHLTKPSGQMRKCV